MDNIPNELKPYIRCINIPNIQTDSNFILNEFIKVHSDLQYASNKLVIFDRLEQPGSYFPSAHTDIEWNKITNFGFQIWSLIQNNNNNNIGNMYLLYNPYLWEKYKNTSINLRIYKNKIAVVKNCKFSECLRYIKSDYILELIPIPEFIKNTKKYYLDFKSGDSILFKKNVLHMSDYRDTTTKRQAFNFRVAIKENNKINISDSNCGYVNDKKFN